MYAPVTPKPAQHEAEGKRGAAAFSGDAPWALSALPECFDQVSKSTSTSLTYVLARLPARSAMVRPPAVLHYADCTIRVAGDELYVNRGGDRMRIPPPVRLYTRGAKVALLRGSQGGYELRVYAAVTSNGNP